MYCCGIKEIKHMEMYFNVSWLLLIARFWLSIVCKIITSLLIVTLHISESVSQINIEQNPGDINTSLLFISKFITLYLFIITDTSLSLLWVCMSVLTEGRYLNPAVCWSLWRLRIYDWGFVVMKTHHVSALECVRRGQCHVYS